MGVQQNIETILAGIPADADFQARLEALAGKETIHRDFVADHSAGVARFSAELAAAVGFSPEDCEDIRFAARMHDIGKLAIPDDVLRKRGKLDAGERAIITTHAAAGAELLGPDAPQLMLDIARYHHERYDGHGYEGLKGEDIPLAARIVNVADVHDALVQERDYKNGMPEEDALRIMTADEPSPGFGRRAFDPFLLRRFVSMRLADPTFRPSDEARSELTAFALSDPMSDIPGGPEANGGWSIKASGHRVRHVVAANGNLRMDEMLTPAGVTRFSAPQSAYDPAGPEFRPARMA